MYVRRVKMIGLRIFCIILHWRSKTCLGTVMRSRFKMPHNFHALCGTMNKESKKIKRVC